MSVLAEKPASSLSVVERTQKTDTNIVPPSFPTPEGAVQYILGKNSGIAYLQYADPQELADRFSSDYQIIHAVLLADPNALNTMRKDSKGIIIIGGVETLMQQNEEYLLNPRLATQKYQQCAEAVFFRQAVRDTSLLYIAPALPQPEAFGTYVHKPTGQTSSLPWSSIPKMNQRIWSMEKTPYDTYSIKNIEYPIDAVIGKNNSSNTD